MSVELIRKSEEVTTFSSIHNGEIFIKGETAYVRLRTYSDVRNNSMALLGSRLGLGVMFGPSSEVSRTKVTVEEL